MKRRDFLRAASGAAGISVAAGTASANPAAPVPQVDNTSAGNETGNQSGNQTGNQSGNGSGNDSDGSGSGGLPGEGTTKTVTVGPGGNTVFDPETVYIQPGGTIEWEWASSGHNVAPDSENLPEGTEWAGHETIEDEGFTYSHQFTVTGEYPYVCTPHEGVGMVGSVVVNESGQAPGGGEGATLNPEEMGVPFQAHFVGIATVLMMFVSLVYTFFTVKYGESQHASSPE